MEKLIELLVSQIVLDALAESQVEEGEARRGNGRHKLSLFLDAHSGLESRTVERGEAGSFRCGSAGQTGAFEPAANLDRLVCPSA